MNQQLNPQTFFLNHHQQSYLNFLLYWINQILLSILHIEEYMELHDKLGPTSYLIRDNKFFFLAVHFPSLFNPRIEDISNPMSTKNTKQVSFTPCRNKNRPRTRLWCASLKRLRCSGKQITLKQHRGCFWTSDKRD